MIVYVFLLKLGIKFPVRKYIQCHFLVFLASRFSGHSETELFTKIHFMQGEMEAAALIWVQHFLNITKDLSEKKVSELLEAIPEKISISQLWPWLKHFVPSLLSIQPNTLSQIISWSCRKTNQLEKLHRSSWPQVGLDFVKGFIELLNVEETHECSSLYQQYAQKNSPLQRLMTLFQTLTDLQRLKESYR